MMSRRRSWRLGRLQVDVETVELEEEEADAAMADGRIDEAELAQLRSAPHAGAAALTDGTPAKDQVLPSRTAVTSSATDVLNETEAAGTGLSASWHSFGVLVGAAGTALAILEREWAWLPFVAGFGAVSAWWSLRGSMPAQHGAVFFGSSSRSV